MCILFIYTNPNPNDGKYQLILATNRDEYYNRPAAPAHWWPEDDFVIAGKDMEPGREGGTWFGVSFRQNSNFKLRAGALLNITGEPKNPDAVGRGGIVTNYLKSNLTAEKYIEECLKPNYKTFSAFCFVAIELSNGTPKIVHYSNVSNETTLYEKNNPEVFGFSNSLPNEPLSKVLAGVQTLQTKITHLESLPSIDDIFKELRDFLRWDQRHLPDPVLARRVPNTSEQLSSVFVNVPNIGYGTRTHTILLVDYQENVTVLEETMDSENIDLDWIRNRFHTKI